MNSKMPNKSTSTISNIKTLKHKSPLQLSTFQTNGLDQLKYLRLNKADPCNSRIVISSYPQVENNRFQIQFTKMISTRAITQHNIISACKANSRFFGDHRARPHIPTKHSTAYVWQFQISIQVEPLLWKGMFQIPE